MIKEQDIVKKYENKLLGTCDYKKDGNFYLQNFQDKKQLVDFLYGLEEHENSLTKSGFRFLQEYYGLDAIAEMLLKENPKYPYDNKKEIIEWLNTKNEYAIEDEDTVEI